MASAPSFAVTPRMGTATLSVAETAYSGTLTNFATVLTGGSVGTRVAEVIVKSAQATNSAAVVRLFAWDGNTNILLDEIAVSSVSGGTTVASSRVSTLYNNLVLPSSSWSLRVAESVATPLHVTVLGADL